MTKTLNRQVKIYLDLFIPTDNIYKSARQRQRAVAYRSFNVPVTATDLYNFF